MIPYFSYEGFSPDIQNEWNENIKKVLTSGIYIGGTAVDNFEESFAGYLEINHAVGVGNGYDGLKAALFALHLPPQSKVAVPAHTFIACWNAISEMNLQPIGVDIDAFGNLDVSKLTNLPHDLKAIMIVHMHGHSVDMTSVMEWAEPRKIKVIEDCSQAHGGVSNGRKVGTIGDVGVFSFYPTKNLPAAGDAGIVVTKDEEIAASVRQFCNYGSDPKNKYNHKSIGVNSRLDPIQAAILSVNLRHLDVWNQTRIDFASHYLNLISSSEINFVHNRTDNNVFHHFLVESVNRNNLRHHLQSEGIHTEIHYPKTAASEWCGYQKTPGPIFEKAERFSTRILSLPLYPWMTFETLKKVADSVNRYKNQTRK